MFSFNFGNGVELIKRKFKTNKRSIFVQKLIPKTIAACFYFLLPKWSTSGNNIFSAIGDRTAGKKAPSSLWFQDQAK